jgi:hypothetical protein
MTVTPTARAAPEGAGPGEKGLKTGALGFVSSVVIGVASTPTSLVDLSERPVLVVRAPD